MTTVRTQTNQQTSLMYVEVVHVQVERRRCWKWLYLGYLPLIRFPPREWRSVGPVSPISTSHNLSDRPLRLTRMLPCTLLQIHT